MEHFVHLKSLLEFCRFQRYPRTAAGRGWYSVEETDGGLMQLKRLSIAVFLFLLLTMVASSAVDNNEAKGVKVICESGCMGMFAHTPANHTVTATFFLRPWENANVVKSEIKDLKS